MARHINNFVIGFVGSLVAVGLIVAIASTTRGIPTWSGAVAGLLLFAFVGWSTLRTSRVAAQVLAVMRGKGALTVSDVHAALGTNTVDRARVLAALARL